MKKAKKGIDSKTLKHVAPDDGFNYFSGYTQNCHNLPTMYASSEGFVVVGRGFRLACKGLRSAVEAYSKLLKNNEYGEEAKMEYPKIKIAGGDTINISKTQLITLTEVNFELMDGGELKDNAIFLPEVVDGVDIDKWVIARDSRGYLCAVPLLSKESS